MYKDVSDIRMDRRTDGQGHAFIFQLFKHRHKHTVIQFHHYFPIVHQIMACTRFVYTKLALNKSSAERGNTRSWRFLTTLLGLSN